MAKEKAKDWFSTVPTNVNIKHNDGHNENVHQLDTLYSISVGDIIDRLQTTGEFCEDPTIETMEKVVNQFMKEQTDEFKGNVQYYLKHALPLFLKGELKEE